MTCVCESPLLEKPQPPAIPWCESHSQCASRPVLVTEMLEGETRELELPVGHLMPKTQVLPVCRLLPEDLACPLSLRAHRTFSCRS